MDLKRNLKVGISDATIMKLLLSGHVMAWLKQHGGGWLLAAPIVEILLIPPYVRFILRLQDERDLDDNIAWADIENRNGLSQRCVCRW